MSYMQISLALLWAFCLGSALFTLNRIRRVQEGKNFYLFVLLKSAGLLLLGLLIWLVFWGGEKKSEIVKMENEKPVVLVLQDNSLSMDFGVGAKKRVKIADKVATEIESACRKQSIEIDFKKFAYAKNITEYESQKKLQRGATATINAVTEALSGVNASRVVVVSDGANTDGDMPGYYLDLMRNRGVKIFAVGVNGEDLNERDLVVTEPVYESINPGRITVNLQALNLSGNNKIKLYLDIDGEPYAENEVAINDSAQHTFEIKGLVSGWHIFKVHTPEIDGELTAVNNVKMGAFRNTSRRILYLTSGFRAEDRHLARYMKKVFDDRFENMDIKSENITNMSPNDYFMVVFGNMPLKAIPPVWMEAIRNKSNRFLFLPGRFVGDYHSQSIKDFPLRSHSGNVKLISKTKRKPVNIEVTGDNSQFKGIQLFLPSIPGVEKEEQAQTLVRLNQAGVYYPLFLSNSHNNPLYFVNLVPSTWKWKISSSGRIRRLYTNYWDAVFQYMGAGNENPLPFSLHVPEFISPGDNMKIMLRSDSGVDENQVSDVTCHITGDDIKIAKILKFDNDYWSNEFVFDYKPGTVLWITVELEYKGEKLELEKRPVLVIADDLEYKDTTCRPDKLIGITGNDKERFALADAVENIYPQLFDGLKARDLEIVTTSRKVPFELFIGLLLVLIMSTEWWLERSQTSKYGV